MTHNLYRKGYRVNLLRGFSRILLLKRISLHITNNRYKLVIDTKVQRKFPFYFNNQADWRTKKMIEPTLIQKSLALSIFLITELNLVSPVRFKTNNTMIASTYHRRVHDNKGLVLNIIKNNQSNIKTFSANKSRKSCHKDDNK